MTVSKALLKSKATTRTLVELMSMEVIRWSNVTIAAVVEPVGRKAN